MLFLSSSILPSSQVHVLLFPCLAGVLSKFFRAYSFLPCLTLVVSKSILFLELFILFIFVVHLF